MDLLLYFGFAICQFILNILFIKKINDLRNKVNKLENNHESSSEDGESVCNCSKIS